MFPESTFDSDLSFVVLSFVVSWKLLRATHVVPLSGTGVPWVSCLDPPVCHRVQGDSVAKSQPLLCVLDGVVTSCVLSMRSCSWSCSALMCN